MNVNIKPTKTIVRHLLFKVAYGIININSKFVVHEALNIKLIIDTDFLAFIIFYGTLINEVPGNVKYCLLFLTEG